MKNLIPIWILLSLSSILFGQNQPAFESLTDSTKRLSINLDDITTATDRILSFQDRDITVTGNEQIIELPATISNYADVSAPTNDELLADAISQDGGVGSMVRLGKLYRVNNVGPPTIIDSCLLPTDDASTNVKIIQSAVDAGSNDEKHVVCIRGSWEMNERIVVTKPIDLRGGKFVRSDESFATTTSPISISAGSFTVNVDAVPTHWRIGTRVVVRDPSLPVVNGIGPNSHINVGRNGSGGTSMRIDDIVGTTITIGNGSDFAFDSGAEMVQTIDFFFVQSQAGFFDVWFDGNRDNNQLEDWASNVAIAADPNIINSHSLNIYRCVFTNGPGETIFAARNTSIVDCFWSNNNGSIVHISTPETPLYSFGDGVKIIRPYAVDCCEKSQSLDHAEAYVTFSIRSKFITVRDGHFRNTNRFTGTDVGACDVIGQVSFPDDDSIVLFENMTAKNFENIIQFENGSTGEPDDRNLSDYKIKGCTFVACGDIKTVGSTLNITDTSSGQWSNLLVDDCKFWGSRIHLKSFLSAGIRSSEFYLQGYNTGYFSNQTTGVSQGDRAVVFVFGDHFEYKNNKIFAHVDAVNDTPSTSQTADTSTDIDVGVRFYSEGGTDQIRQSQSFVVDGNEFYGIRIPIWVGGHTSVTGISSDYFKAVSITNNRLYLHNGTAGANSTGLGIVTKPGTICRNNEIISIGSWSSGIQIVGPQPAFTSRFTFVTENIIRSTNTPTSNSIQIAVAANNSSMVVQNNVCSTALQLRIGGTDQFYNNNVVHGLEPYLDTQYKYHVYEAPF